MVPWPMGVDVVIKNMRRKKVGGVMHRRIYHENMGMLITVCKLMERSVEDAPRSWSIGTAVISPVPTTAA